MDVNLDFTLYTSKYLCELKLVRLDARDRSLLVVEIIRDAKIAPVERKAARNPHAMYERLWIQTDS